MSGDGKPKHGDVLKFYSRQKVVIHFGIYNKKDNTVIHKTGPPDMKGLSYDSGQSNESEVRSDNYDSMVEYYDTVTVDNRPPAAESRFPGEKVVRNALARLGETSYNLVTDNCETFARECETGRRESDQVVSAVAKVVEVAKDVFGSNPQ